MQTLQRTCYIQCTNWNPFDKWMILHDLRWRAEMGDSFRSKYTSQNKCLVTEHTNFI